MAIATATPTPTPTPIPGTLIFSDAFESGDTSAWSRVVALLLELAGIEIRKPPTELLLVEPVRAVVDDSGHGAVDVDPFDSCPTEAAYDCTRRYRYYLTVESGRALDRALVLLNGRVVLDLEQSLSLSVTELELEPSSNLLTVEVTGAEGSGVRLSVVAIPNR